MLARFLRWLLGRPDPHRSQQVDHVALDVERRQHAAAERLSRVTHRVPGVVDATPAELLDYRRADGLLRRGRR
jgi:hypothetical protein